MSYGLIRVFLVRKRFHIYFIGPQSHRVFGSQGKQLCVGWEEHGVERGGCLHGKRVLLSYIPR